MYVTTAKSESTRKMEFSSKFELPMFLLDDVALWWHQIDTRLEIRNR